MAYLNGRVPKSKLKYFEGMRFFPGTLRRWIAFRDEVKAETGETLELTSAYRDYDEQVKARQEYGIMAAVPGTSSHGGIWTGSTTGRGGLPTWVSGRETGALDVGDYYNIPWATFDRLATKHGFIADIVVPKELWHIVDLDPWGHNLPEEEDMTPEERKMLKEIHHRVHKGLTGERIAGAVWAQNGIGAFIKRMGNRVLANYDSMRDGKKGVRTTGSGLADLKSRMGRVELQNEALLAVVKDLADSKGVDGEAIVQQVAKSVDKALADVSITLTNEEE